MFWSPGEQLNRIRQNPIIWIPLLIVTILYLIGSTIMAVTMKVEDFMVPEMTTQEAEMFVAIGKTTAAVYWLFNTHYYHSHINCYLFNHC